MRTDRLLRRPARPRLLARAATGATLLAVSALLLTGCQASPQPDAGGSQTPSATTSSSSTAKAPSTPSPKPTPVTMTCDQVLTITQLAAMMPPITAVSGFTPDEGSAAATAVADGGVACGYTNPSTGNTVAVSIALPASDDLTTLKNRAITDSNVVPTYGVPPQVIGYFAVEDSMGVAQAFTGDYWIVAESKDYIEPGDASQVIAGVLANLPK